MNNQGLMKALFQWGAHSLWLSAARFGRQTAWISINRPEVSGTPEGAVGMPKQQPRMALNYVNQPPMIPHSVDGYQVTTTSNRCLQCHGVESYRTTGAPRVSPTHFMDSDGKVLSNVAPRRYFCLQCHVPQADVAPIVENTFEPSKGFGK
ncbi:Diheme cytochrome c NapB precursor [Cedecea neteri]|uniref:Periplasmic nitrate reductase, electron transfer subunit n=1 Tax=Cedecea neteri TaxID=158822 RepID=A0A2X3IZ29_9ENTR|nr:Diheme cytochrome c NapB precursor [Cedecea neteri]